MLDFLGWPGVITKVSVRGTQGTHPMVDVAQWLSID